MMSSARRHTRLFGSVRRLLTAFLSAKEFGIAWLSAN
jgi:hypothetical protein